MANIRVRAWLVSSCNAWMLEIRSARPGRRQQHGSGKRTQKPAGLRKDIIIKRLGYAGVYVLEGNPRSHEDPDQP